MDVTVVLIILICYLTGIISIGLLTKKKSRTTDGFFLANRSIGWKSLTATITATTIGGSATIVAGGRIYSLGLPGLWYDIGGAIGLIVLGLFLAKKIRKTSRITLPDITGSLYDGNVRYASAVLILITEIAWIALLIQSSSMILSTIFPIDYIAILLITSIIFITYTLIGGQYAVVYTDIIQFLIMVIGICILAAPLLLLKALPYLDTLPSSHLQFPVNQNLPLLSITSIFFMMFLPHVVGPDIYSKILSSKNTYHARIGTILAGLFKILFAFSIGVIALAATVLPSVQESITNPYQAIPLAISTVHPFIAGILLAAFLATMMSTADSCLLSAGTILSVDIIKNNKVITSQLGILIIGIFALLLAIYYSLLGTILDTLQLAYTVFTAGLTVPVLFGFYKEKTKATAKGALLSLILGGGSSVIFLQIEPISDYAVLIGLLVSVVPLVVFRNGKEKK
jgi:solute:Na+ symporter, SSS family